VVIIGQNFAVREGEKTLNERVGPIGGHINAIFWNRFERFLGWWCEVRVELHVDAAWPLDNRILPDWVVKRCDKYICPRLSSSAYCCPHVGY